MVKKNPKEFQKIWNKIQIRAWGDEVFKQKLFKNPKQVFEEYGLPPEKGMNYRIIEDTRETTHIILPQPPDGWVARKELSEEDLGKIAAGDCFPRTLNWV